MRLPGGCIDDFDYTRSTFFDSDIGLFNAHYIGTSVTEFGLNPAVGSSYRIRDEHKYVNRHGVRLTQDRLEMRSTKELRRRWLWCTNAGLVL